MNGRAYDYNLGRFLSVDPFIQFPENSQSLNPYSYIMNNPLAGTDPSGYAANYANRESDYDTRSIDPLGTQSAAGIAQRIVGMASNGITHGPTSSSGNLENGVPKINSPEKRFQMPGKVDSTYQKETVTPMDVRETLLDTSSSLALELLDGNSFYTPQANAVMASSTLTGQNPSAGSVLSNFTKEAAPGSIEIGKKLVGLSKFITGMSIVDTAYAMAESKSANRVAVGIAIDASMLVISNKGNPGIVFGLGYGFLGGSYGIEQKFSSASETLIQEYVPPIYRPAKDV